MTINNKLVLTSLRVIRSLSNLYFLAAILPTNLPWLHALHMPPKFPSNPSLNSQFRRESLSSTILNKSLNCITFCCVHADTKLPSKQSLPWRASVAVCTCACDYDVVCDVTMVHFIVHNLCFINVSLLVPFPVSTDVRNKRARFSTQIYYI